MLQDFLIILLLCEVFGSKDGKVWILLIGFVGDLGIFKFYYVYIDVECIVK